MIKLDKYLWDDVIIVEEQTKEILLVNEQHFESHSWGLWKIKLKDDGSCVGFAGLWFFFNESQPQLLYGLLPQYTGQGYASEASKAMLLVS